MGMHRTKANLNSQKSKMFRKRTIISKKACNLKQKGNLRKIYIALKKNMT